MIELGVLKALHGAKAGSDQERWGKVIKATLATARANGFKDAPLSALTEFAIPEGAVLLPDITMLSMSNEEMEKLADSTIGLNVGTWARDIIQRARTASSEGSQMLSLTALDSRTMGLRANYPTTKQVLERTKKFGDKISAEAMVKLAVEAAKGNIQVEIGKPLVGVMESITDSDGHPSVLAIARRRDGLWLNALYANLGTQWDPGVQFVVSPPQVISS